MIENLGHGPGAEIWGRDLGQSADPQGRPNPFESCPLLP